MTFVTLLIRLRNAASAYPRNESKGCIGNEQALRRMLRQRRTDVEIMSLRFSCERHLADHHQGCSERC